MTGMLARSKAGHDKGKTYLIIKEDEQYVYLADGVHRTLTNPKKKKQKHIQLIKRQTETLPAADTQVKRIIKLFLKEEQI